MSKSKATVEPLRVLPRTEVTHGIYHIIAGHVAGSGQALAYLGGRRIHAATGDTVEAAVASVIDALELRVKALRAQREGGVPAAAEFHEALQAMDPRLVANVIPLLRAHRYLPQGNATFVDIQRATGRTESAPRGGNGGNE